MLVLLFGLKSFGILKPTDCKLKAKPRHSHVLPQECYSLRTRSRMFSGF